MPMTGQPIFAARSIALHIFSPITSPSEPPKTVKSCEKTTTGRPSIVPWPVTTASPHGRFLSISKSCVRWRTNVSSSWNEPGSSSLSMRSRAVSFPRSCCFSTAASDPAWAAWRSSSSCWTFSSYVSGFFWRLIGAVTLLAAILAAAAPAHAADRCHPRASRTLARSEALRVYRLGSRLYACRHHGGSPQLVTTRRGWGPIDSRGTRVVVALGGCDNLGCATQLRMVRVRRRGATPIRTVYTHASDAHVASIELGPRGTLAWT